jgi:hypothetical protein
MLVTRTRNNKKTEGGKKKMDLESAQVSSKKSNPFATQTGLELVNAAPEEYHGLVDDLLLEVGVSMLCGKPKTGKSTLSRQLAFCIAEGKQFLGKPVQCGDVLYLSLEGPKGVVQEHLKKLGITQARGTVHVVHEQMPLRGELGLGRLEDTIRSLPALKLVVVDPVSKLLRMADSDSYDEVTLALEKLERLAKDHSLHLLFTTHGKKRSTDDDGDSPIGSTGFRAGTDTNIFLSKRGAKRVLSTEQRWGIPLEATYLTNLDDTRSVQLASTVGDAEEMEREDKSRKIFKRIESEILDVLLGKQLTTGEIANSKDVVGKTTTIIRVLQQMAADGKVVQEQDGKATRYRLPSIPTEVLGVAA